MTETNTAAPYENGAEYDVRLKSPVRIAGIDFLPRHEHTMTGEFLNRIVEEAGHDVVDDATNCS